MTKRDSAEVLKERSIAIRIPSDYSEPGPRNCEETAEQLADVLDTAGVRAAMEQTKRKRRNGERVIAPDRYHHAQASE